ncbi:amino acid adenylation domain-containing protein, partial [Paraburkholderia fungorum]|uniref:amino acid adenylation domain-containing protein n=1 Tax=Paraburkholderia fungorum TaxID=134537 RepID=UPI0038BB9FFD
AMAQFELTLNTTEALDGTMSASFVYARELFDAQTVERLAEHYVASLNALVSGRVSTAADVELMNDAERAGLLASSKERRTFAVTEPLHVLIERHAAATPQATAVVFEGNALSYAELNARANRMAHRLIEAGVRPEVKVGVAMTRSADLIVALLAVLKSGGAYVPLDPSYPAERIAYMSADSGIAVLVVEQTDRADEAETETDKPAAAVRIVEFDSKRDTQSWPAHNPNVAVHADNLAYVIYTSGSTGKPKGAQLTHRNVTRLLAGTREWFDFGPADVWTMFHSYAFDFSVWEIFGALCHGGRLVVVPHIVSRSPDEFAALLRRERVTVLNQTPSAFRQLMLAPSLFSDVGSKSGQRLALRAVIFGGEALELHSLRPWIAHFGDARPQLINMYGITETTVHVTYRRIIARDLDDTDAPRSPLGKPIPDLGLYVLDAARNPVPAGVEGELYVSGAGLARGYLNRAALTAERFVPDPFGAEGGRLYRTGDLARRRADGEIEYVGRIDHQVKIRGFRIELGEIESQLTAQAGVREALVIAEQGAGAARLIAYVCTKAGVHVDAQSLRAALLNVLPDYMVPAAFVVMDAFPLTSNGKVDRKALPAPEQSTTANHTAQNEAPEGAVETALAAIWQDVLGVEQIGRHANFFELGGDSILSLQIVARLRRVGLKITPRQLFERQTVALL